MRFLLTLETEKLPAILPVNYQYPLSSVIYKIIQKADEQFAAFLHETGYGKGNKKFKLFTFSDINTPFKMRGDRMLLLSDKAEVNICFYLPRTAENFIKGIFINQFIEIGDRASRVVFHISQIESIVEDLDDTVKKKIILQPLSPIVAGIKNEKNIYTYLDPADKRYSANLIYNWLQKYKAITDADDDALEEMKGETELEILFFRNPPQSRLITIKAGNPEETKIRGFKKFRLQVKASGELLEIALGAGLGLYNAQGMGCVEIVR
ncbi:MAG: CRISPR-associated endoribonuclease Cas6 [Chitinophagaceae bacterium]|nr:CRISPR-associated endoribonuclease Cas6 [Chitinophagaceae bacterium]